MNEAVNVVLKNSNGYFNFNKIEFKKKQFSPQNACQNLSIKSK